MSSFLASIPAVSTSPLRSIIRPVSLSPHVIMHSPQTFSAITIGLVYHGHLFSLRGGFICNSGGIFLRWLLRRCFCFWAGKSMKPTWYYISRFTEIGNGKVVIATALPVARFDDLPARYHSSRAFLINMPRLASVFAADDAISLFCSSQQIIGCCCQGVIMAWRLYLHATHSDAFFDGVF